MTGTVAYILAKKIALGAVSGIKNIKFQGTQLVFEFNDGSSASMAVPLPKDGISIVNVEINQDKHIICTMSDGSTIDAGQLDGIGGGLVQVNKFINLPKPGREDTLYITKEDKTLYYWDDIDKAYKIIESGGVDGINFKTHNGFEFDGTTTTFDLPVKNKTLNVYVNGIYLTEDIDYTVDYTSSPPTITFEEPWEEEDACIVTWIEGKVVGDGNDEEIKISLATKEDIDSLFKDMLEPEPPIKEDQLATKEDIDNLFKDMLEPESPPVESNFATKQDIDNLFKGVNI